MRFCPVVERGAEIASLSWQEIAFGETNPRKLKRRIHQLHPSNAVKRHAAYETLPVEMDMRGEAIDGVLLPQERVEVV